MATFPKRVVLCSVWLLAVMAGTVAFWNYGGTAGSAGATPQRWPTGISLSLDAAHDTLLMFAHPQCACTRASLEELNQLMAQCEGKVTAHVLFFKPDKFSEAWTHSGLRESASAIPGTIIHDDPNGVIAARFGAETSGYVVLYSPQGQLLFEGGITGSRGHAGDNAGQSTLISLLNGRASQVRQTPVFGCSLLDQTPGRTNAAQ
jgi:hypothetical protein